VYTLFIQPFLLGLSVGLYCFAYCLPFVSSYLVSEKRSAKDDFKVILQFITGRFFGYLLFGAFFGYLGEKINNPSLNLILIISLMVLSALLIVHALNLFKVKWVCAFKIDKYKKKFPLMMGFFLGVNLCPPFLISLTYVFTLHDFWKGIIYFVIFFIGTSLYFLPITFLGALNKMKEFRLMARLAALIVGTGFLIYGLYYLIRGGFGPHLF
jgi:sulfite exporter TauE/SafE